MHLSILFTFLSLFFTLTLAAPTPITGTSLSTLPVSDEADSIASTQPLALITSSISSTEAEAEAEAEAGPKTYGLYLHVADPSSESTQTILDLTAVEAAKEAVKETLDSGNGPEEKLKARVQKFRAGSRKMRGGAK